MPEVPTGLKRAAGPPAMQRQVLVLDEIPARPVRGPTLRKRWCDPRVSGGGYAPREPKGVRGMTGAFCFAREEFTRGYTP